MESREFVQENDDGTFTAGVEMAGLPTQELAEKCASIFHAVIIAHLKKYGAKPINDDRN